MGMVAFAVLLASNPGAEAFPSEVSVELFGAHPELNDVFIFGPVSIIQPFRRQLPPGLFVVKASRGNLELFPLTKRGTISSGVPLLKEKLLVLSNSNSPLRIGIDPAALRSYRGELMLRPSGPRVSVFNKVSARNYVASVVGSETDPSFQLEELKAQSVLAQTLLSRYKIGDRLSDTTETEAYLGAGYERPQARAAVDATWGQVLSYENRNAKIYFHSTCAGGTSNGGTYFALDGGPYPYLNGRVCQYCKASPFWKQKKVEIPESVWNRKMGPRSVSVASVDSVKRPLQVLDGTKLLNGYSFWMEIGKNLGWDKVPGSRYSLVHSGGKVVITSSGAGHGVGMCQWGANKLAQDGKSYRQILQFYFPGTTVRSLK